MRGLGKLATAAGAAKPISVSAQHPAPMEIGVITLMSGPEGSPFGLPPRNTAGMATGWLNAGKAGA